MFNKATRIVIMTFTVLLLFGTIGILAEQPNKVYAAETAPIGIVDYMFLIDHHPDMKKANESFKVEFEQAKKTFETKSVDMNEQDKKALETNLNQQVQKKRQELFQEIAVKVNAEIKAVADAKGLSIVLPKNIVIYGGQDITDAVMTKIKG